MPVCGILDNENRDGGGGVRANRGIFAITAEDSIVYQSGLGPDRDRTDFAAGQRKTSALIGLPAPWVHLFPPEMLPLDMAASTSAASRGKAAVITRLPVSVTSTMSSMRTPNLSSGR